jgi:ABC-type lipoprotein release transport system permease subunit
MAGYSGTPLLKKLGIKPGFKILLVKAAPNYLEMIGGLPGGCQQVSGKQSGLDFIHLFVKSEKELEKYLPALKKQLKPEGMLWVSWYKKSSGIATDVTEDTVRNKALAMGLVDIKVCAVDDLWSGLKVVIRKRDRM